MRRDENDGLADAQVSDLADEGRSIACPDGHRVAFYPWHGPLDHRRDAREHVGRPPAPGTAEEGARAPPPPRPTPRPPPPVVRRRSGQIAPRAPQRSRSPPLRAA